MTQIVAASGGEVDIVNFIGNHECIKKKKKKKKKKNFI